MNNRRRMSNPATMPRYCSNRRADLVHTKKVMTKYKRDLRPGPNRSGSGAEEKATIHHEKIEQQRHSRSAGKESKLDQTTTRMISFPTDVFSFACNRCRNPRPQKAPS